MVVRLHRAAGLVLCAALLLPAAGCGKGDAAASATEAAQPVSLSTQAAPRSAKERLKGTWNGVFAVHANAPVESFEGPTVDICKSIRMRVVFHANGKLEMSASMTLPEIGSQTNDTDGHWTVLSEDGDTVHLRSQEGESEPEEVTVVFSGDDAFEMTPPNELKALGVLRFTRG